MAYGRLQLTRKMVMGYHEHFSVDQKLYTVATNPKPFSSTLSLVHANYANSCVFPPLWAIVPWMRDD